MRRFRTILGLLLTLALVAIAAPAAVLAGTQGTCSPHDTSMVRLWENIIGDTSDNNDSYWKCGDDSDLDNDDHTLPGTCKAGILARENWNDCVSSVTVYVATGYKWCFYGNSLYGNPLGSITHSQNGNRVNLGSGANDGISSFRWRTTSQSC